jgi:hypothetical protein
MEKKTQSKDKRLFQKIHYTEEDRKNVDQMTKEFVANLIEQTLKEAGSD